MSQTPEPEWLKQFLALPSTKEQLTYINRLADSGGEAALESLTRIARHDRLAPVVRGPAILAMPKTGADGLAELLGPMLKDYFAPIRAAAAEALGTLDDPQVARMLSVRLSSEHDDAARLAVIRSLGKHCGKREADELDDIYRRSCNSPPQRRLCDAKLRREIILALERIGPDVGRRTLVKGIADEDAGVSECATRILSQIRVTDLRDEERVAIHIANRDWDAVAGLQKTAVEPLRRYAERRDGSPRRSAISTLGRTGCEEATGALLGLVNQVSEPERREIVESLVALGDVAISQLVEALNNADTSIRLIAARALRRSGWQPGNENERAVAAVAAQDWRAVIEMGEAALDPLSRLLHGKDEVLVADAARAAAGLQSATVARALVDCLLTRPRDSNVDAIEESILSLGRLAFDELTRVTENAVTLNAVDAYRLCRLLKASTDPGALPLLRMLAANEKFRNRTDAVSALVYRRDVESVGLVARGSSYLGNSDEATGFLATYLSEAHYDLLPPLPRKTSSAELLGAIAKILTNSTRPEATEQLRDLLQTIRDQQPLRDELLLELGRRGDLPTLEAELEKLSRRFEVTRGLVEFLTAFNDPRTVEPLCRILQNGEDDIRKTAIPGLGRSGDERALSPLIYRLSKSRGEEFSLITEALRTFGDRAQVALLDSLKTAGLSGEERYVIVSVLLEMFPGALERLQDGLDSDEVPFGVAVRNLAHAGSDGVAVLLKQLAGLGTGTWSYADAVKFLEQGGDDAPEALEKRMAAEGSASSDAKRCELIYALGESGDMTAVPALVEYLSHEDPKVRKETAQSLARLNWKAATDEQRVLYSTASGESRPAARFGPAAIDSLWRDLQQGDRINMQDIGEALLEAGGHPQAVEFLIDQNATVDLVTRMLERTKRDLDIETLRRLTKLEDIHWSRTRTAPEHDNWAYAPEIQEEGTTSRSGIRRIAKAELNRRSSNAQ